MSNFIAKTKHPVTGVVQEAEWLDDYYGRHRYGVRFPDGEVFPESTCKHGKETEKLIDQVGHLRSCLQKAKYMRERQKIYIKDKSKENIIKARQAEANFDRVLAHVEKKHGRFS